MLLPGFMLWHHGSGAEGGGELEEEEGGLEGRGGGGTGRRGGAPATTPRCPKSQARTSGASPPPKLSLPKRVCRRERNGELKAIRLNF